MTTVRLIVSTARTQFLIWLAVLFSSLYLIYGSLFKDDPFIEFDDPQVIHTLAGVHSLSDYFALIKSGAVYDRQPVRDAVTLLDYYFLHQFNLSVFHLTNVLIFIVFVLGFRAILKKVFDLKPIQLNLISLIFAVNPLYVTAVAWVSSRKHIMAAAFIVWASKVFLDWIERKEKLISAALFTVLYGFAIFSQPIVLPWPIWCGLMLLMARRFSRLPLLIPVFFLMIFCIWINFLYYSGPLYLSNSGGNPKFVQMIPDFYPRLTLIGRYFFQMLIPYWTSASAYAPGSWQNYAGLLLLPIFVWILIKKLSPKLFWSASLFVGGMLSTVILQMTNIFGHDTYLVSASVGFYLLMWALFQIELKKVRPLISGLIALVILVSFLSISKSKAERWDTKTHVFEEAFAMEPGSQATEMDLAGSLLVDGRNQEGAVLVDDLYRKDPENLTIQGLAAYVISRTRGLTVAEKLQKIDTLKLLSPYSLFIRSELEMAQGNWKAAYDDLNIAFQKTRHEIGLNFDNPELQLARYYFLCLKAKESACSFKTRTLLREKNYSESRLLVKLNDLKLKESFENGD